MQSFSGDRDEANGVSLAPLGRRGADPHAPMCRVLEISASKARWAIFNTKMVENTRRLISTRLKRPRPIQRWHPRPSSSASLWVFGPFLPGHVPIWLKSTLQWASGANRGPWHEWRGPIKKCRPISRAPTSMPAAGELSKVPEKRRKRLAGPRSWSEWSLSTKLYIRK